MVLLLLFYLGLEFICPEPPSPASSSPGVQYTTGLLPELQYC